MARLAVQWSAIALRPSCSYSTIAGSTPTPGILALGSWRAP